MQHLPEIIRTATALSPGAASPGPGFVVAASMGRLNGVLAALGD
ncbi:hypothetical protein [Kosakonia radicincitans]|nr:hypothetical protein [Kosakonia radicincitans]KIS42496.1 hypothetical protein LG58_1826 [Kosakonia radicincitans YD4]